MRTLNQGEFLKLMFDRIWAQRPMDLDEAFTSITTIPAAMCRLREQSHMTIEQMAARLGLLPSRMAYLEVKGNVDVAMLRKLQALAEEYSMPRLAKLFGSKAIMQQNPLIRGNKVRGRRPFGE